MRARLAWIGALLWLLPPILHAQTPPETIEYYALDALGSVRVVFDATGNIIGQMDYGPFGQELFGGTHLPDRRFAGLFRDGEAGLDAAGARSYQSRTGRFSSVDPIYAGLFEPQRWNRYAYALNSPIGFVDPTGLQTRTSCMQEADLKWACSVEQESHGSSQTTNASKPSASGPWMSPFVDSNHGSSGLGQVSGGHAQGGPRIGAPRRRQTWMNAASQSTNPASDAAVLVASVLPASMSAAPMQTTGDQQLNQVAATVYNNTSFVTKPWTYAVFFGASSIGGLIAGGCLGGCNAAVAYVGNAALNIPIQVELALPGAIQLLHDSMPALVDGPTTATTMSEMGGALYTIYGCLTSATLCYGVRPR